ncbi:TLD-domain-containing protein [Terfezia boudieri ATCC MYA-4762]|uniref:Oxidation resistance protein 1 n=1 Tax=Terfezia boudieri ATCC MYA-4762 TaxID=1051890 RepID=A0A3N4M353_9PEZI|nr:TLD-domain-containing protein [Terfezia boudieri ATCC MYA-4762]
MPFPGCRVTDIHHLDEPNNPSSIKPLSPADLISRSYHYPFAANACLQFLAPTRLNTNTTSNSSHVNALPTSTAMPSTASASSSHTSLPGTLSSALSWTLNRWNSSSNTSSSTRPSSRGTTSAQNTLHPTHPSEYRSSYPPSTRSTSSRPPSRRRASPFQPPPLPPLSLIGYTQSTTTHLLTPYLAEEIRQLVPPRLQLYDSWILAYSLEQHGVSLTTLYERCAAKEFSKGGFVLVVKDDGGGLFGAFVNEGFRTSGGRYYGTGECFLWKAGWVKSYMAVHAQSSEGSEIAQHHHNLPHLHHHHHNNKANGVDKEEEEDLEGKLNNGNIIFDEDQPSPAGTPNSISENVLKFKAFPYSGINEYFILCEQGFLSVGAGNGKFGLWLDSNLEKGVSSTCATFGNEPLSEEGEKFEIMGVEVWSIGGS